MDGSVDLTRQHGEVLAFLASAGDVLLELLPVVVGAGIGAFLTSRRESRRARRDREQRRSDEAWGVLVRRVVELDQALLKVPSEVSVAPEDGRLDLRSAQQCQEAWKGLEDLHADFVVFGPQVKADYMRALFWAVQQHLYLLIGTLKIAFIGPPHADPEREMARAVAARDLLRAQDNVLTNAVVRYGDGRTDEKHLRGWARLVTDELTPKAPAASPSASASEPGRREPAGEAPRSG